MTLYGYARVSVREPEDKNLDLQEERLVRAGCSLGNIELTFLVSRIPPTTAVKAVVEGYERKETFRVHIEIFDLVESKFIPGPPQIRLSCEQGANEFSRASTRNFDAL